MPLLDVQNLSVCFHAAKESVCAVQDISFTLDQGESLALVGESGSGKSVTALSILGLISTTNKSLKGQILLNNTNLLAKTDSEMQLIRGKQIGIVFQDPMTSLNPSMSIGWQIAEALVYHHHLTHRQALSRAKELLHLVGIVNPEARLKAYPFQLSGGMRQRVMLAIAISCQPLLLIADEPTTALDATTQAQILHLLHSLQKETQMSLLLITHDLSVAASLCTRAAVMQQGSIVEIGNIEDLFHSPTHTYTQALVRARQGLFTHAR